MHRFLVEDINESGMVLIKVGKISTGLVEQKRFLGVTGVDFMLRGLL